MENEYNELNEIAYTTIDDNISVDNSVYNICSNIYNILSVLCFVIIVIFLFKYLKSCFKKGG